MKEGGSGKGRITEIEFEDIIEGRNLVVTSKEEHGGSISIHCTTMTISRRRNISFDVLHFLPFLLVYMNEIRNDLARLNKRKVKDGY